MGKCHKSDRSRIEMLQIRLKNALNLITQLKVENQRLQQYVPKTLVTRKEIAFMQQVSRSTVDKWCTNPNLQFPKPIQKSGAYMYLHKDVENWFKTKQPGMNQAVDKINEI